MENHTLGPRTSNTLSLSGRLRLQNHRITSVLKELQRDCPPHFYNSIVGTVAWQPNRIFLVFFKPAYKRTCLRLIFHFHRLSCSQLPEEIWCNKGHSTSNTQNTQPFLQSIVTTLSHDGSELQTRWPAGICNATNSQPRQTHQTRLTRQLCEEAVQRERDVVCATTAKRFPRSVLVMESPTLPCLF